MKITRRGTIIGTVAVLGCASGASILSCRPSAEEAAVLDLERLPNQLRVTLIDIVAPERIGSAYRGTRTIQSLAAELAASPWFATALTQGCPTMLRAALRAQVIEDFRTGDVVVADRFMVARSECLVAALIA